jgi:anaerobic selenocysteine-containing dehydrogenase
MQDRTTTQEQLSSSQAVGSAAQGATNSVNTTDTRTFCRICEPSCGLIAKVEAGRLVKLVPDREHPVTKGFACHKGLAAVDLHHDPDRLNNPMLRAADGTWNAVPWDEALTHTASRLEAIIAKHGIGSVCAYVGNPLMLTGPISASLRVPSVGPFPTGKPDWGPRRLQRSRAASHRNVAANVGYPPGVFVGDTGLCQQVCGQ